MRHLSGYLVQVPEGISTRQLSPLRHGALLVSSATARIEGREIGERHSNVIVGQLEESFCLRPFPDILQIIQRYEFGSGIGLGTAGYEAASGV